VQLAAELARAATEPRTAARESTPAADPAPAAPGSDASAEAVRTTASGQFYISPYLTYDSRAATVIFQLRDSESGDVTRQFPPESVVELYRRDPTARPFVLPEPAGQQEPPAGPPPPTIGGPVAEAVNEAERQGEVVPGPAPTGAEPAGSGQQGVVDGGGQPATTPRTSVDLVA